jgi:hypothetical protein
MKNIAEKLLAYGKTEIKEEELEKLIKEAMKETREENLSKIRLKGLK